jgi:hypothetical protein
LDDFWKELKTRWREILCTLINILYLCIWVAAQVGAAYFIQMISIEKWLSYCFRIVFGLSTLCVVVIYIWEDISRILIRSKARIENERKMLYHNDVKEQ